LKGLLKGFWWPFRSLKSVKYFWSYGPNEVCDRKIGFLGVVIGPNRIKIEKVKVNGVLSWLEPKNIKDIRKFLDLANYYRRFIKDFA